MSDFTHAPAQTSWPLPTRLRAQRMRVKLVVRELLELPPHKGGLLRGLIGVTLKRLACAQRERDTCPPCVLGNGCPYGYLFEPTLAPQLAAELDVSEPPSPFVVEPPEDLRLLYRPGEELELGLVLIGRGLQYLPYLLMALEELGEQGVGRRRARYQVASVVAEDLLGTPLPAVGTGFGGPELVSHAAGWPADRLTLHYATPARLKHRQRFVSRPDFAILIAALARRVALLAATHADEPWTLDPGALQQAARVQIAAARTNWSVRDRYAPRQQQGMSLSGIIGDVTYVGPLAPFRPLLALGELVHVGKAAVFGNGRFSVHADGGAGDEPRGAP
ncbi:MAG: CRISPR system precrRNA processing endoribonuclease RAMP protein Cas6 [Oscillochloridaceae bacterium umkhey_bin13]